MTESSDNAGDLPEKSPVAGCEKQLLLLAARAITEGAESGKPPVPTPEKWPPDFRKEGASFVTLKDEGRLRGCMGSPRAHRPLGEDVSENAFSAAFRDPRFPPVTRAEIPNLRLSISLLTEPEPLDVNSQEDLLEKMVPHRDGLIFEDAGMRGLFLPAVWETLPDKGDFLAHLKLKAGLPSNHWSENVRVHRFFTVPVNQNDLPDPKALWEEATRKP